MPLASGLKCSIRKKQQNVGAGGGERGGGVGWTRVC